MVNKDPVDMYQISNHHVIKIEKRNVDQVDTFPLSTSGEGADSFS